IHSASSSMSPTRHMPGRELNISCRRRAKTPLGGRRMTKRIFYIAILLMTAMTMRPAAGQDGKAEGARTVAAANQEGPRTRDTHPNIEMRKYIQEEWAKAYPKIALSVSGIPGSQYVARLRTE